jgi:predicted nucleic acid-binding protein
MSVLVDTTVWSLALRRDKQQLSSRERKLTATWAELVVRDQAKIIGPIRMEILSGISNQKMFENLRVHLASFADIVLETADYERAAELFNVCRKKGVQSSHVDMLICAVAERYSLFILTTDADFELYSHVIGIHLYKLQ